MKPFLALNASAGSGKTYALTLRYISLLFLDANPNSILTLTFTNKAASEMSERIFKTLLNLGSDPLIVQEIATQTNLSISDIILKKEKVLNRFLSNELFIITLDTFINKILREFCGYLDLSDDFKIENDDYDLMLYKFLLSLKNEDFHSLIEFSHTNDKKLHSIVGLFALLDDKNIDFKIVEFSASLLGTLEEEIVRSATLIKEFILDANLSNSALNAVNFDDLESLLFCGKTWLTKESLTQYSYFKKATIPTHLDTELQKIKSLLTTYFKYKEIGILNNLFAIFNNFRSFRYRYKKEKNSLQFNDITNLVYLLLQKYIDKDFLYFRLDAKYDHILIDEFQDTSIIQYKILEPMIEEIVSSKNRNKTFFYVGDTKQSIYRFRGGKKELFSYVASKFSDVIKLEILDTNYRSGISIVEFVNTIFSNQMGYEYHQQKVKSETIGGVEVVVLEEESLENLHFLKSKLEELFAYGIKANNIAILTYTNRDVEEIYTYLKIHFPTIQIVTDMTSKLINQKNVQAIINLIKYFYFQAEIYKANFNSIMGYDTLAQIEFFIDIQKCDLIEIVKDIAIFYSLLEENVLKFIEDLGKYSDIVDFVYEIDKNDTTMVNSENQGLQILTIFKSKGLEFDTVLLLDRMKNKNTDKSALLFSYNKIELDKIYYKEKIREEFDEEYKNSIEDEKNQMKDDELNVLYVALTRGKNNLIVFKKEKQSSFDILDFTIDNYKSGTFHKEPTQADTQKTMIEKVAYTPLSLGFQEIGKKEKFEDEDLKARYFGIGTHYCLEMMKNFTANSLLLGMEMTKNKFSHILTQEDFIEMEQRLFSLIENSEFQSLLKNATYTKEQSLLYDGDLKIIDLLLKKEDGYVVVDYKTTLHMEERHKVQVKNYVKYIKQITNSEVFGYIIYLQKAKSSVVKV